MNKDDGWCSLCGSMVCCGECVDEPSEEEPVEKIEIPCWECMDCGFISRSYTTERCMECGSENTAEVLPSAAMKTQIVDLQIALKQSLRREEQLIGKLAYFENEVAGIREYMATTLGRPRYDSKFVVCRSRDGLIKLMPFRGWAQSILLPLKPDVGKSFPADPLDGPLDGIKYRQYELTPETMAGMPVYEEIGE
jgi:hypothetical protein